MAAIVSLTPLMSSAQSFSNLTVSYNQCNPGTTWSGWRQNSQPAFSFMFDTPYTSVEITVRSGDGSYNQSRPFNGPADCYLWPENLPSGSYDWTVRVFYQKPPNPPIWSPTAPGSVFHVDITAPNQPIVSEHNCGGSPSGFPAWVTGTNPVFSWSTPTDAHSGLNRCEVSVNGGGWSTVVSGYYPTVEGSVTFDFRSVDNVGNVSPAYRIYVRTDKTAPPAPSVIELHCGPQGIWTVHNSPYFIWMPVIDIGFPLNGSGVNRYEVSVNSGTWQTVSPGWEPTYGTGQYTFFFRSVDNVGLASGLTVWVVYIDDTRPNPPMVTEHNCNGSYVEDPPWSKHINPVFTWDNPGDSGSGIPANGYSASFDEENWITVVSPWLPEMTVGSHRVFFRSTDRVGNVSAPTIMYLRLDPIPPYADAGSDIITDKYEPVTFSASNSNDNVGIDSYAWTFNDGSCNIILDGVSPTHTFNLAGVFEVTLTVKDFAGNETTDNLTVTVNTPTGADLLNGEQIIVYPVPAKGILNINLPSEVTVSRELTCELVLLSGKILLSERLEGSTNQLDVNSVESGVYYLVVRAAGVAIATKRVMIQQ